MTFTSENAAEFVGKHLYDLEGHKIGTIDQVVNGARRTADWAYVSTGLLHGHRRLVPITDAEPADGGLTVPYSKDTAHGAPDVDPLHEALEPEKVALLTAYYADRRQVLAAEDDDPERFRVRPHHNETTFGTGTPAPGEPDDVTMQGTGTSAPRHLA